MTVIIKLMLAAFLGIYSTITGDTDFIGKLDVLNSIIMQNDANANISVYQVISEREDFNTQDLVDILQYKSEQQNSPVKIEAYDEEGTDYLKITTYVSDAEVLDWLLDIGNLEFISGYGTDAQKIELDGHNIKQAEAQQIEMGMVNYAIQITFDETGRELFYEMTNNHIGETISIVLNNNVLSEPYIQMPIDSDSAQITGLSSFAEAKYLASCINVGCVNVILELQD